MESCPHTFSVCACLLLVLEVALRKLLCFGFHLHLIIDWKYHHKLHVCFLDALQPLVAMLHDRNLVAYLAGIAADVFEVRSWLQDLSALFSEIIALIIIAMWSCLYWRKGAYNIPCIIHSSLDRFLILPTSVILSVVVCDL